MGLSPSPDLAKKIGAGIGVVTLICAITANASTSNVLLLLVETTYSLEVEVGVWQIKQTTIIPALGSKTTEIQTNGCDTDGCLQQGGSDACCDAKSHKCKGSKALAVFGA